MNSTNFFNELSADSKICIFKFQEYLVLKKVHQNKRKMQVAFEKMMSIFGGKKEYEALPVLDVGERCGSTGYIDYIRLDEMTAPMMRGTDRFGRRFFIIRYRVRNGCIDRDCQTFFERFSNQDSWAQSSGLYPLIEFQGYIIDEGLVNEDAFSRLKNAIKTKSSGDNTIE